MSEDYAPKFDYTIEGTDAFLGIINSLESLANDPAFIQTMADCAMVVESRAKDNLTTMVYSLPETGYKRKHSAGLFGKTMATKVVRESGAVVTGVGSFVFYGIFVNYGTGRFAADGKGRKTPWIYKDEYGNFHKTVGMKPRPYLTKALQDSKDDILELISDYLKSKTGG